MAAPKAQQAEHKRKPRKRNARTTQVSSSSESESDVPVHKSQKAIDVKAQDTSHTAAVTRRKKANSNTSHPSPSPPPNPTPHSTTHATPASTTPPPAPSTNAQESFGAIYLRRIAAELADDLDKVRGSPDFRASSVAMLVHALRQGESVFGEEERRRVVGAGAAGGGV